MKKDREHLTLYLVTDRRWIEEPLEEIVEECINAGVTMVQLREKEISFEEFVELGRKIKKVTDKYDIPFVINDNIEVAKEINADGVHIGQDDINPREARNILGKEKIIGVSVKNIEEAKKAETDSADYLGVGAMFPTDSKLDASDLTIEEAREIVNNTGIPVVAIGGINKENIKELKDTGMSGVAIISGILKEKDRKKATEELHKLSKEVFYGRNNI